MFKRSIYNQKFAEIRKINYICSVNKKGGKYENLKFLLQQRKKRITFNFVQQKKEKNYANNKNKGKRL